MTSHRSSVSYTLRRLSLLAYAALVLALGVEGAAAQSRTYALSGTVVDSLSGAPLPGATLALLPDAARGATADEQGRFALALPAGGVLLRVSFVGYAARRLRLRVTSDTSLTIRLVPDTRSLGTATVSATRESAVESVRLGEHQVSAADVRVTPQVLGEADGLKTIQLLPGVRGGSEASAGLYVRDGGPDQNLVLLDGLPLYGTTHLFGFFSAFPTEALENIRLLKGSLPARYGGRLSSVVEIEPRSGSRERVGAQGSLGVLSSQLALDGPLADGQGSFIIAGRRTLVDLLTRTFARGDETLHPYFYDGYGRLAYSLGRRTEVMASMYGSRDDFLRRERRDFSRSDEARTETENFQLGWSNQATALRLLHEEGGWKGEAGVGYVGYGLRSAYERDLTVQPAGADRTRERYTAVYGSRMQDARAWLHGERAWLPEQATSGGVSVTGHRFTPAALRVRTAGEAPPEPAPEAETLPPAYEADAYAEHDATLGRLRATAGLRGSWIRTDAVEAGAQRDFYALQPRLSARYALGDVALKGSYARTVQAVHLLVSSTAELPTELWLPSNSTVRPSTSSLWSIGGAYEPRTRRLSGHLFTAEAYLKRQEGVVGYRDGASYADVSGGRWTDVVARGGATSLGLELFAERRVGRLTGWAGYTLSRTMLSFPDLNEGVPFPARFDRRHDLSLVTQYALRPNLAVQATWVYGTGEAVTLPIGEVREYCDEVVCPYNTPQIIYSERNGVRLPAYHRLDLSLRTGYPDSRFSFSAGVFNAYNRLNPFYVTPGSVEGRAPDGTPVSYGGYRRVALFPALPFARLDFKL